MELNLIHINDTRLLPDALISEFHHIDHGPGLHEIDPSVMDLSTGILACPLDKLPIAPQDSDWLIAALTGRPRTRIELASSQWSEDETFWLPEGAKVYCPQQLIWKQLISQRNDLISADNKEDASAIVSEPFDSDNQRTKRQIHPAEVTPAPVYGAIALVCSASDLDTRKMLRPWHNEGIGLCTNVERSIRMTLAEDVDHLGAQCEIDRYGRYQLNVCAIKGDRIERHRMIQDSWAGMAKSAVSMIRNAFGI